jgi:hypothetical protein
MARVRLPFDELAIVSNAKLVDYLLNKDHPRADVMPSSFLGWDTGSIDLTSCARTFYKSPQQARWPRLPAVSVASLPVAPK